MRWQFTSLWIIAQKLSNKMQQGTVSVLFGCHSPIHSVVVLVAWHKLYHRWPKFWQIVCIFIHDIGHWGTMYLDNPEEKERHSVLGAEVARNLFGDKGYEFCLGIGIKGMMVTRRTELRHICSMVIEH